MRGFSHCGRGMAVIETRHTKAGHITRRRECLVCGYRITTRERIILEVPKATPPIKVKLPRPPKHDPAQLNEMYQTMTLKEVGAKAGITLERVRQILRAAGYSTQLHCRRAK